MVGTVAYNTASCCYKLDLEPAKLFFPSNIMKSSLLKQLLDLFRSLYPSKKRNPISSSKGKESKEVSPLKNVAGKTSTIYLFFFFNKFQENIYAL